MCVRTCVHAEGWPTGGSDDGRGGIGGNGGGVLVKKPVITRLDSGLGDRKMHSTPPEDSTGRTASGRERE